jgi:hypothetical protein
MMNIFKTIILNVLFLAVKTHLYSQINDVMRDGNIKTQIIWVTEKNKFGEKKFKKQELRFNKKGFCIEEIKYNPKGKIIFHKSYSYAMDLLEREIEFDSKGFIVRRIDYKYVNKVLTEKTIFNGQGDILSNEQMIYEYQD